MKRARTSSNPREFAVQAQSGLCVGFACLFSAVKETEIVKLTKGVDLGLEFALVADNALRKVARLAKNVLGVLSSDRKSVV